MTDLAQGFSSSAGNRYGRRIPVTHQRQSARSATPGSHQSGGLGRVRAARGEEASRLLASLRTDEAADDLTRHLAEEFDRELLEEALARVRLRIEPHTWEAFQLTAIDGLSGAEVAERVHMRVSMV